LSRARLPIPPLRLGFAKAPTTVFLFPGTVATALAKEVQI